jgi:hypothetical protein
MAKALRARNALVASVVLVLLLVGGILGNYVREKAAVKRESLAAIQAEWKALKAEEDALPAGSNAAEVWTRISALLPKDSWARIRAEGKGEKTDILEAATPALSLVDEALGRERCLFPINGGATPFGLNLETPYGPQAQSDTMVTVPTLLDLRARRSLAEGRPRDALEDARRILLAVRQGMERCYHGPLLVSGSLDKACDLVRDVLRRENLSAADARFAAALPNGEEILIRREAQSRLHRLHGDIDAYAILYGSFKGKYAADIREELGLPHAVPFLGFSIRDPGAVRTLRTSPDRPLRAGFEKWPESGPPGCLVRLDLLRVAAALRAFGIENGRPAPNLHAVKGGSSAGADLVYEVRHDGWALRNRTSHAPAGMQSLFQDPHWFDAKWIDLEMDLSFAWPPK